MSTVAIAPATRVQLIARPKRRGARPVPAVRRSSALDEEDSCGSTVTAFELDRAAGAVVVAGPHVLQVEALTDPDLRAEERLVRRITLLLRSPRLGPPVVETGQLQAPPGAPPCRPTAASPI